MTFQERIILTALGLIAGFFIVKTVLLVTEIVPVQPCSCRGKVDCIIHEFENATCAIGLSENGRKYSCCVVRTKK